MLQEVLGAIHQTQGCGNGLRPFKFIKEVQWPDNGASVLAMRTKIINMVRESKDASNPVFPFCVLEGQFGLFVLIKSELQIVCFNPATKSFFIDMGLDPVDVRILGGET